MKLFQQLLIAPAALGLLAPVAANADVIENVKDLNAGAFASATKLTGSSVFTTGFVDTAATADNKLTVEYNYKIDLNSSFTGEDNLYAGLEAGNQNDIALESQVNNGNNAVNVASLYYEFPLGEFTITAGPLFDQDDVISATTSIYSSNFRIAEMPWGTTGNTGAGVGIAYVNDNGWNASANLLSLVGSADVSTVGAFTREGTDMYSVSVGYDTETWGGGIIAGSVDIRPTVNGQASTKDDSIGGGMYFRPEGWPTISIALDKYDDEDGQNSNDFFIGLDQPLGDGTLSAAYQARDNQGVDLVNYEVYYNYPINDGVSVQGGVFSNEVQNADNTQGFVVETFFTF